MGENPHPRIFDIHPHVISTDTVRYPNVPVGGHNSDWSRERPVSVEQMIAAMDLAGIAKSALVQASNCYRPDNSYVVDAVAAHPERFTGVFSIDPLAGDAPDKIRHWVSANLRVCGCSPWAAPPARCVPAPKRLEQGKWTPPQGRRLPSPRRRSGML